MGIENFYGQWLAKYRRSTILSQLPQNVVSLFIDGNGILHQVAQETFSYGEAETPQQTKYIESLDPKTAELLFLTNIQNRFAQVIETIKPSQTVVIAIDGVGPPAKLQQQRKRRFMAANGKEVPSGSSLRFNSSSITPGTEIMKKIDNALQAWIMHNRPNFSCDIIYSSHMVHGEGEHKIFQMIRDGKIPNGNGAHVVYGLDADLVMLSLMSPFRDRMFLVRENYTNVVSIGSLAASLHNDLNGKPAGLGIPIDITMADFVAMCCLVGNDFLPRFFCINNVGEMIQMLIGIYSTAVRETRQTLTSSDGRVVPDTLTKIFEILASKEDELLTQKASYEFVHPSKLLEHTCVRTDLRPKGDVNPSDRYKPRFKVTSFNSEQFHFYWYWNMFRPRTEYGGHILKSVGISDDKFFDREDVIRMCRYYLYGIQWVLSYYRGDIHTSFYSERLLKEFNCPVALDYMYPYRSAPLLTDIAQTSRLLHNNKETYLNLPIKPFYIGAQHQLVAVIPFMSSSLIPKAQRGLISQSGSLGDLSPISFEVEMEAINADHQAVPILPPMNLERIISEVDTITRSQILFKEEEDWVVKRQYAFPGRFVSSSGGRGAGREGGRGREGRGAGREGKEGGRGGRGRGGRATTNIFQQHTSGDLM